MNERTHKNQTAKSQSVAGNVTQRKYNYSGHPGIMYSSTASPVIQRVLDITASTKTPFTKLKYAQFQSLSKRYKVPIKAWVWLREVALSPLKITFDNWKTALGSYNYYKSISKQLRKPQTSEKREFRFGASKPASLNMKDAHGLSGMTKWILDEHPISQSTYISPGGSADLVATAVRAFGGEVIDIPLSGIKEDNLKDGKRDRAITFIKKCFHGKSVKSQLVIFDAISTGSALKLLKELIADALTKSPQSIKLVALNNPPGHEGKALVQSGAVDVVSNTSDHVSYAKSRIENQSYKDFGRKYPKNQVGELTDSSASRLVKPSPGMSDQLMTLILAMLNVSSKPFVEKQEDE